MQWFVDAVKSFNLLPDKNPSPKATRCNVTYHKDKDALDSDGEHLWGRGASASITERTNRIIQNSENLWQKSKCMTERCGIKTALPDEYDEKT